jgi:anti-anti-sigma factor
MTQLTTRQAGAVTIVDISRSFMDMGRTSELRGTLRQLVTESLANGRKKILLNMSAVGYCGNTALGELIGVFKTIRSEGGRLKLCNVPASVRAGLELSRVLKIFEIHDDEVGAIRSFEAV